ARELDTRLLIDCRCYGLKYSFVALNFLSVAAMPSETKIRRSGTEQHPHRLAQSSQCFDIAMTFRFVLIIACLLYAVVAPAQTSAFSVLTETAELGGEP